MTTQTTSSTSRSDARSGVAHRSDVCIVGNGAIAKTAALGLSQAGHSVTLLVPPARAVQEEGAATGGGKPWDTRVYALNHTAHTLLSSLKVWGALDMARVAPVDAMEVQGDGQQAGHLGFDAFGAHADTLAWIVEDANLGQALDAALRFAQNVRIVTGRATRLATTADGATVELDDGSRVEAELVVGADGRQSWVRGQCDIGIDYRSYRQRGVVTNFYCEKPHHNVAHQWFTGKDGIVALLPLPGNRVSLVWSAPDALADTIMNESLGELAIRLGEYAEGTLGVLKPLAPEELPDPAIQAIPLLLIRPHSIVAPRVALAGDAAHGVHPLAGHGMNLGFADVVDLLNVLGSRDAHQGIGEERVLARYARARKEDVLLMQFATDSLERLFGANLEPLRVVRNFGLNLLDKLPMVKRRLIAHAMGR